MKNYFEKLDNYYKEYRLKKIHPEVINSFKNAQIKFKPISVIFANQKYLKSISFLERDKMDYDLRKSISIEGLYSKTFNSILLDNNLVRFSSEQNIKRVLAHEYAHMIYNQYNSEILKKYNENKSDNNFEKISMNDNSDTNNEKLLENLMKEYISNLTKIKRTNSEKRDLEFFTYFEEMYAESVSQYLFPSKNSETELFEYSQLQKGEILSKDKYFFEKIQEITYRTIYDSFFEKSLKEVTIQMPNVRHLLYIEYLDNFREKIDLKN